MLRVLSSLTDFLLPPQAKSVKSLTLNRFNNFQGGHYESVNLTSALYTTRADGSAAVKLEVWSPKAGEKPSFDEAKKQKYKPAKKGDSFGPSCELTRSITPHDRLGGRSRAHSRVSMPVSLDTGSNHWFKITLNVPKGWLKYERVQCECGSPSWGGCLVSRRTPGGPPLTLVAPPLTYPARLLRQSSSTQDAKGSSTLPRDSPSMVSPALNPTFLVQLGRPGQH